MVVAKEMDPWLPIFGGHFFFGPNSSCCQFLGRAVCPLPILWVEWNREFEVCLSKKRCPQEVFGEFLGPKNHPKSVGWCCYMLPSWNADTKIQSSPSEWHDIFRDSTKNHDLPWLGPGRGFESQVETCWIRLDFHSLPWVLGEVFRKRMAVKIPLNCSPMKWICCSPMKWLLHLDFHFTGGFGL